ncbi:hypothetical protein N7508_000575 [Penicillium antarcticum]|uniref:uncharacterized protein n=1 Tax=Penicillium antarcticum TaxID=416450 RepID=UPI00238C45B4|nr:uncharacterized protein N7508_000575 [Penicillium antarcticum]KAJ5320292.1 hypothetical protein N7508_000575 [Penicillium antarcticum]
MHFLSLLGLTSLAAAAKNSVPVTTTASSTTSTTTSTSSIKLPLNVYPRNTTSKTAIIVASDGTGQFTAIQDGISYAQIHAIPTVTVLAGTYTYSITVSATPTVTVNVNLINTGANYADMVLKGNKYAFYDCQIVSTGTLGITASVGLGVIANLYIETLDKIIYG